MKFYFGHSQRLALSIALTLGGMTTACSSTDNSDGDATDAAVGGMNDAGTSNQLDAAKVDTQQGADAVKSDTLASDAASKDSGGSDASTAFSVWPPGATKLIAENQGGGFAPAPPQGSTCSTGAAVYTVTAASKNFAFKECLLTDALPHVYAWKQGQRALSDQEYSMLTKALDKVAIVKRNICGADKPVETLKVTTAAGETEYVDSFYACQAKAIYIDNIDAVFDVFRNFTKV